MLTYILMKGCMLRFYLILYSVYRIVLCKRLTKIIGSIVNSTGYNLMEYSLCKCNLIAVNKIMNYISTELKLVNHLILCRILLSLFNSSS